MVRFSCESEGKRGKDAIWIAIGAGRGGISGTFTRVVDALAHTGDRRPNGHAIISWVKVATLGSECGLVGKISGVGHVRSYVAVCGGETRGNADNRDSPGNSPQSRDQSPYPIVMSN